MPNLATAMLCRRRGRCRPAGREGGTATPSNGTWELLGMQRRLRTPIGGFRALAGCLEQRGEECPDGAACDSIDRTMIDRLHRLRNQACQACCPSSTLGGNPFPKDGRTGSLWEHRHPLQESGRGQRRSAVATRNSWPTFELRPALSRRRAQPCVYRRTAIDISSPKNSLGQSTHGNAPRSPVTATNSNFKNQA